MKFIWIVSETDAYDSRNNRIIGVFNSIDSAYNRLTQLFKTDIMPLADTKEYLNSCLNPRYTVQDHTNKYTYSIVRHEVE